MIKQTLMFTTPVSLSLKNEQLIIARKDIDETVSRPIEDIGFIVIANQLARHTAHALAVVV